MVQYSRPSSLGRSKGYGRNSTLSSSSILPPKSKGEPSKGRTHAPFAKGKGIVVQLPSKGKGSTIQTNTTTTTPTTSKGQGVPPAQTPPGKGKGIPSSTNINSNPSSYRSGHKSTSHLIREKLDTCQEVCFHTDPQLSHENILPSKNGVGKGKGSYKSTKYSRNGEKRNVNEIKRRKMSKGKGHTDHLDHDPFDACCQGGVSFLKLTFVGDSNGTLSLNTQDSCESDRNDRSKAIGGKGGKGKSTLHLDVLESKVRFVNCNDPCTDPSSGMKCTESKVTEQVYDGKVTCFGSWDLDHDIIAFHEKLPKSVNLSFQAEEKSSNDGLFAVIHTSCSQPIYPPYGVAFRSDCKNQQPFHVTSKKESSKVLEFQDGISTDFYKSDRNDDNELQFHYNFATCRCVCDDDQVVPSPPPLLSTPFPSPTPTSTTESPTFDANHCNELCVTWVSDNCFIPGDDLTPEQTCIPSDLEGRRLKIDRFQSDSVESRKHLINYHEKMIAAYKHLLTSL
jgi:hypothetical protein